MTMTTTKRRDRGQALVEFSLLLIPFLWILMGIVDLGRGIYIYNGVNQAARELARVTSVHQLRTSRRRARSAPRRRPRRSRHPGRSSCPASAARARRSPTRAPTVTDARLSSIELSVRATFVKRHRQRAVLGGHAVPRRVPAELAVLRHPRPGPVKEPAMGNRRWGRGEDGQMLVIFSLCLVAIIAMTGLVIDGGMTFVQKREQQNVADAAALAGAYAYVNSGNASDAAPRGPGRRGRQRLRAGTDGVTVTVSTSMVGGAIKVTATVTKPHRNYFSGIVGFNSWPVTTTATAHRRDAQRRDRRDADHLQQEGLPARGRPGRRDVVRRAGRRAARTSRRARTSSTGRCTAPPTATATTAATATRTRSTTSSTTAAARRLVDPRRRHRPAQRRRARDAVQRPVGARRHRDNEFPVAIVDDDGNMVGWAMFHLTGRSAAARSRSAATSSRPVNRGELKIVQGVNAGGNFGDTTVRLTN